MCPQARDELYERYPEAKHALSTAIHVSSY